MLYNKYMSIVGVTLENNKSARRKEWHNKRKQRALEMLGGKCCKCGSLENLEFDHIEPGSVSFRIVPGLRLSWARVEAELKKCQLLCHECHLEKTCEERHYNRGIHGIIGMYSNHGCRCDECTRAWAEYYRNRRRNKK